MTYNYDDFEKLYEVEFLQYHDLNKSIVHKDVEGDTFGIYLEISDEPFIVRESELKYYSGFGHGFRSIKFVGNVMKKPVTKFLIEGDGE